MRKKLLGTRHFGERVDVTDPCYDKDVWCRTTVTILPGEYTGYIWREWKTFRNGTRFAEPHCLGIYRGGIIPPQKKRELIGTIGVDAGMFGFFENKPDYGEAEWQKICQRALSKNPSWLHRDGFITLTADGDGAYPLYGYKDDAGNIVALELYC